MKLEYSAWGKLTLITLSVEYWFILTQEIVAHAATCSLLVTKKKKYSDFCKVAIGSVDHHTDSGQLDVSFVCVFAKHLFFFPGNDKDNVFVNCVSIAKG